MANLRRRAALLAKIRAFFAARGVWEVETPALSTAATTDPALDSYRIAPRGEPPRYLHTSPEFPMKRLLAAGSGDIYQLARVFRPREQGRYHNPEFTLLEWYRLGFDDAELMAEVAELVAAVLAPGPPPSVERLTYREAFTRFAGVDPFAEPGALEQRAVAVGIHPPPLPTDDPDPWRHLLMSHLVEPHLGTNGLCFITDYPASQAALARLRPADPGAAARFELYWQGVELANGFWELCNVAEQRRRFAADLRQRRRHGLTVAPCDHRLLAALEAGLPDCAGVALGVDRLAMLVMACDHLDQVLAFPQQRA